jgi:hypothetical protein
VSDETLKTKTLQKMQTMQTIEQKTRPLWEIAREIKRDWKKVYFGAAPYLDALSGLETITDSFGYDSGSSIVRYFLANASTWKGETAKRVKTELKNLLK